IIGSTHVDYVFYSSGTVNINTTCSKNPYKLETCRLKERKHPAEKLAIEFVNDIFNPIGRLEKQIAEIEKKVDVMLLKGDDNNNHRSLNGISLQNGKGGNDNNSCPDGRRRMMKGGEE
ncbi:MAG: hypothetical protein WCF03_20740, partial [Nitrososphaeraceae archaeon]